MNVFILRYQRGQVEKVAFDYTPATANEKTMALDVLLQATHTTLPDLAYRYGCRNLLCGVCTIDLNGKSVLACRTPVKENDTLSAMATLPVVKDLIVKRSGINAQLLGQLPSLAPSSDTLSDDHSALHNLNRCIECYACLSGCESHAKNNVSGPYTYGNPYSFLKIQKIMVSPAATPQDKHHALGLAKDLGIETYHAKHTPRCGVGINLKKDVILPLQHALALEVELSSTDVSTRGKS